MRRTLFVASLAAFLLLAPAAAAGGDLTVSADRIRVDATLGHSFVVRSTIANHGTAPATGLIAHLNVLSLDGGVYVDPEDWSSQRTRYLDPIAPGGTTKLSWKLSAVNAGRIGVYVAVLPRSGAATPVAGPNVAVRIADRRTLDAGGILPLALGIPLGLGLLALGVRLGRTRARRPRPVNG